MRRNSRLPILPAHCGQWHELTDAPTRMIAGKALGMYFHGINDFFRCWRIINKEKYNTELRCWRVTGEENAAFARNATAPCAQSETGYGMYRWAEEYLNWWICHHHRTGRQFFDHLDWTDEHDSLSIVPTIFS